MKKDVNTDKELKSMDKVRKSTWKSFDEPEGQPDWSMATSYLFDDLDALNVKWLGDGRHMFVQEEVDEVDPWDEYWVGVENILKKYVVQPHLQLGRKKAANAFEENEPDSEAGIIAKNIIPKLRWYKQDAGIAHLPRLRIPVLTPKMLDALAANITRGAEAFQEVSNSLYL
jgi:hypothetical protein